MDTIYKLILIVLVCFVSPGTNAATVAMTPPAAISAVAGGGWQAGAGAAFSGTSAYAYNSGLTTQVGGKAVTVPAAWRMSANAGQFIATGVRGIPGGLIGPALAVWLLTQGLEWLDGQWKKKQLPEGSNGFCYGYSRGSELIMVCSPDAFLQVIYEDYPSSKCSVSPSNCLAEAHYTANGDKIETCYTGQSYICRYAFKYNTPAPSETIPATAGDWEALAAKPFSAAAANEALGLGIKIPVSPLVDTAPQIIPLSDPYLDPKTGALTQDVANVRPSSDGKTAAVEVAKQEVAPDGSPAKEPGTDVNKPQTEEADPCKLNPDSSGCKPLDEVPDQDLQKVENLFSINPVSGFGAENAACPAPKTLFNKGGQPVVWEWTSFCTFASGIRPFIIGMAWIAAIAIVVAVGRRAG